ncbi:uncharacterized protein LOC143285311 [Babylonia areolata]|uniref:uncharacterized protein LOC143285311 n=1 Tax=Babylonia areolata TaxID=304850 RepID=UPI003FD36477
MQVLYVGGVMLCLVFMGVMCVSDSITRQAAICAATFEPVLPVGVNRRAVGARRRWVLACNQACWNASLRWVYRPHPTFLDARDPDSRLLSPNSSSMLTPHGQLSSVDCLLGRGLREQASIAQRITRVSVFVCVLPQRCDPFGFTMTSCLAMDFGRTKKAAAKKDQPTPALVPRPHGGNTTTSPRDVHTGGGCCSAAEGKENAADCGKQTAHGWLSRVCSKLRGVNSRQQHHRRGPEKCEKCGQKSDTCQPNASFLSGRKHYLCEECRTSSDHMRTMYRQWCRNLSLHDPPRIPGGCHIGGGGGGGALVPASSSRSSSSRGVVRSRSMRSRPVAAAGPESGYDTATSLESSCSNGRLSPAEHVCGSPEDRHLRPDCSPRGRESSRAHLCLSDTFVAENGPSSKDKPEVFGGSFTCEKAHLALTPRGPLTRVYTRQPPPPYRPRQSPAPAAAREKLGQDKDAATYDGYLEIQSPNSEHVKYVFRPKEEWEGVARGREDVDDDPPPACRGKGDEDLKLCYRCNTLQGVAFQAPFGHGWLCEDCMDDLM